MDNNMESQSNQGQADTGSDMTTGNASTDHHEGQPTTHPQTTGNGNGNGSASDDTFFDYNTIKGKPELEAAYRSMQSAFTRKMQGLRESRSKVEAYDAITKDPLGAIQRMASSMGYRLSRPEAEAISDSSRVKEPQSWEDVYSVAEQRAIEKIQKQFAPLVQEFQGLKRTSIETQLDSIAPDWRHYEDAMMSNLQKHPSLANDPETLYRISVPYSVLESRATKAAIDKLSGKSSSSRVSSGSTTKQKSDDSYVPKTVSEAAEIAKRRLAEQGIMYKG